MQLSEIKDHWEQAGRDFKMDEVSTSTSRDPYLGKLEEDNILSCIPNFVSVLEIGCGDGSHTISYAKKARKLCGIDVSAGLIEIARERMKDMPNVELSVGSALILTKIYRQRFDCIVSQRCLINLPTWEYQKSAILQYYDVLEKDGVFLLTEGFDDGLNVLNMSRRNFGLKEIQTVSYNRNLIRDQFESFVSRYFKIVTVQNYGFYLFLSRLFHPLAVLPDEPKHDSKLNEVAMKLSRDIDGKQFEKYSYNLFYMLRKK